MAVFESLIFALALAMLIISILSFNKNNKKSIISSLLIVLLFVIPFATYIIYQNQLNGLK
ncbi:hypothetical protein V1503_00895 [Bacillus sp. SCS-151]|uniref:hypothetical protein n=1 Tax=Nanhaiella sioensis TaxID=3115293 RepID=UPI003977F814